LRVGVIGLLKCIGLELDAFANFKNSTYMGFFTRKNEEDVVRIANYIRGHFAYR